MEVCYVCKEPAKYYDDYNQFNGRLRKCGVSGCNKLMHPTNKCSSRCKSGCGSSLCHKHKEQFRSVKDADCWKNCTACTRICIDCNERFTWEHYNDNNESLAIPAPERCEECTFLKKGICIVCFELPVQDGTKYCETCANLRE